MTKDADKLLCCIYKIYLERRKSGMSKSDSKEFQDDFYKSDNHLSSWSDDDISDTLEELKKNNHVRLFIDGSFTLENNAIIYMENRFKNGLTEVLEILSKAF